MGRRLILFNLLSLVIIGFFSNSFADDHDEAYELLHSGEILPLEKILEVTRKEVQGIVLEVEIEHKDKLIIYEIEVLQKNGIVREIKVNAVTGIIHEKEDDQVRVLLVEDDPRLAEQVKSVLGKYAYAVDISDNGVDGEFKGDEEPYELIILDLGLPQRSGSDVLKNWRSKGNKTPVLILTARNDWSDRVDGLTMGADDYLGKPFYMQELLARVKALIRRSHGEASSQLSLAGITLDNETKKVTDKDGMEHELTNIEFRLLHYFMTHPGAVLSKNRLIEHVYEGDIERNGNVIEVYIRRLRNKLGKNILLTRRHQGYVFPEELK